MSKGGNDKQGKIVEALYGQRRSHLWMRDLVEQDDIGWKSVHY